MQRLVATIKLDGTNRSLQRTFAAFNVAFFSGQLDSSIRIKFGSVGKCVMGEYNSADEQIVLNPLLKTLRRFTCLVLLHEMCHVVVAGPGHGKKFQTQMCRLANIGAFENIW